MPAIHILAALLLPGTLLPCPGGSEPRAASPTAAVHRASEAAVGIVLGDAVNVRAGPGTAYEVTGKLGGGERVEVLGEAFGWLLVRPAAPPTVYIGKDLIERKGGGVAAVKRDRVNLRTRPGLSGTVVGQASRGDVVRLAPEGTYPAENSAEADGFVAIAAPPDVALYVHRDLVRLVDPSSAEARAPDATVLAGAKKATDGGAMAGPGSDANTTSASTSAPFTAHPTPAEKALRARDMYLGELDKTDLGAMDFAPAQALYEEALREAATEETRAAARAGLRRVKIALALQEDYRRRMAPIERLVEGEKGEQEPCEAK